MRDPLIRKICIGVCIVHLSFLLLMIASPNTLKINKQKKQLVIKTLNAHPVEKKGPRTSVAANTPAPPTPRTPTPTQPKKTPPPPSSQPSPDPKKQPEQTAPKKTPPIAEKKAPAKQRPPILDKKPAPKKAKVQPPKSVEPEQSIPQELLDELEESIAKIDQKRDNLYRKKNTGASTGVPHRLEKDLAIDIPQLQTGDGEGEYQEALVSYLHQSLNLPEFGEVKIQLTLNRDGTVVKLVVLKTESEKNKKHLEAALPLLKFPPLGGLYSKKQQQTFVLTFCNEVN